MAELTGAQLIAAERMRQITRECWTPEHDDGHVGGELAEAAACYAVGSPLWWPWAFEWWKPTPDDRIRGTREVGGVDRGRDRSAATGG